MAGKETKKKKVKKETEKPSQSTVKKLYKSKSNRMLGGVCGGISEYLDIDSTIIRLVFIVMAFFGGSGIIIYIAGLLIFPEENAEQTKEIKVVKKSNVGFWGALLIVLGVMFLVSEFGFRGMDHYWMWHGYSGMFIPVIIIALGAWLLLKPSSENDNSGESVKGKSSGSADPNKLSRSVTDRKISGVCGGMGEHFNIDTTIVRLLWIVGTLATNGFGILAYIILIIALPETSSLNESGGKTNG